MDATLLRRPSAEKRAVAEVQTFSMKSITNEVVAPAASSSFDGPRGLAALRALLGRRAAFRVRMRSAVAIRIEGLHYFSAIARAWIVSRSTMDPTTSRNRKLYFATAEWGLFVKRTEADQRKTQDNDVIAIGVLL